MKVRILLSVLAVAILAALIGVNTFTSAAAIPENPQAHGPLETVNALRTALVGTLTVVGGNLGGTISAVRGDIGGTVTAFAGTLQSYRSTLGPTLTAIAPTLQAFRTNFPATGTALAQTLPAIRPAVIGTATAFAATVQSIKSTLALTPVSTDVAAQAIVGYGVETFGIPVTVTKAGGADANIVKTFPVPSSVSLAQTISTNLTTQTYVAQLTNGSAWLSTGYGTASSSSGGSVNIQSASFGVFSLKVPTSGTLDAASALALAKTTYPGIAGYTYAQSTTTTTGFVWYTRDANYVALPVSGQIVTVPQTIILAVVPGDGSATVSAAVGRGVYAYNLNP